MILYIITQQNDDNVCAIAAFTNINKAKKYLRKLEEEVKELQQNYETDEYISNYYLDVVEVNKEIRKIY